MTHVVDRRTVHRLIEYEGEIIKTTDGLEDASSNALMKSFVKKCAEHLITQQFEINSETAFTEVKSMYKTSFQSEMFVSFWLLIYTLIEVRREKNYASSVHFTGSGQTIFIKEFLKRTSQIN